MPTLNRRRNKYGVAPKDARTYDGVTFASKREMEVYIELSMLARAGAISCLERQPKFPFPMGFSYVADFAFWQDGKRRVIDVKGHETAVFKLKRKCMEHFYPTVKLEVWK